MSIENYYSILGIDKESKVPDIKKAYRTKAKIFHPDLNKSPDAHDKFIEINEAYEFVLNVKLKKIYNGKEYKDSNQTSNERYKDWVNYEKDKARQRATYYSNTKYSEFKKSQIYKTTELLSSISDYMFIALGIIAPVGAIFGLFYNGIFYFQNGEEKINYLAIITAFMISLFGAAIITFFILAKKKS